MSAKSDDAWINAIIAFAVGAICATGFIAFVIDGGKIKKYSELLKDKSACERSLPRDKFCIFKVVPKE